jgi:hypothetical protein
VHMKQKQRRQMKHIKLCQKSLLSSSKWSTV